MPDGAPQYLKTDKGLTTIEVDGVEVHRRSSPAQGQIYGEQRMKIMSAIRRGKGTRAAAKEAGLAVHTHIYLAKRMDPTFEEEYNEAYEIAQEAKAEVAHNKLLEYGLVGTDEVAIYMGEVGDKYKKQSVPALVKFLEATHPAHKKHDAAPQIQNQQINNTVLNLSPESSRIVSDAVREAIGCAPFQGVIDGEGDETPPEVEEDESI